MAIIYIVRHGRAAASFDKDLDPGLDDLGQSQAESACRQLAGHLPLELVSSPLKRARETAEPLARHTGNAVHVEERVSEIPSPGLSVEERGPWLRGIMGGNWRDQSGELQSWRQDLADYLTGLQSDTAIFSHYVAINVAVGVANDDDRVLIFRPDNGSVTTFETDGTSLRLVELGGQAQTRVN